MTVAEARPREASGKVLIASPHGFCAGVERAIGSVERTFDGAFWSPRWPS